MAKQANAYAHEQSHGKELKRDVSDVIANLSPTETPLYTGLKTTKATASIHTWNYETVSRSSSQSSFVEAGEIVPEATAAPTLATNYVQEFVKPFSVSWKQLASETIGGDSYKRAKGLAMKNWKLAVERDLIAGSPMSGGSNSPWQLKGAINFIDSGNVNSYPSLTTLTEEIFNDIAQKVYDDVSSSVAEAYMKMALKRRVSSFTAGVSRQVDATDRRLISAVDIYEGDVISTIKLFAHRDMVDNKVMLIVPKAFRIAFLEKPNLKENPVTNYAAKTAAWYGSLTLEMDDPGAGAVGTNLR